jgi:hypothetical protein
MRISRRYFAKSNKGSGVSIGLMRGLFCRPLHQVGWVASNQHTGTQQRAALFA